MTVGSVTSGLEFGGSDINHDMNSNPTYASIENYSSFGSFTGGGTKQRKPLSKKAKQLTKMRLSKSKSKQTKKRATIRRNKERKLRQELIQSLSTSRKMDRSKLKQVNPSMRKFIIGIPKISQTTPLSPLPSISGLSLGSDISLNSDIDLTTLRSTSTTRSKKSKSKKAKSKKSKGKKSKGKTRRRGGCTTKRRK